MMKSAKGKLLLIFSVLFILLSFSGCGSEPPPDDGTKEPPALNGTFTCAVYGHFAFNGDGESVDIKVTKKLSDATGLPEGISGGSYVFLFNGAKWRYDKADTMQIIIGRDIYRVTCVPGGTGENSIELRGKDGTDLMFNLARVELATLQTAKFTSLFASKLEIR